MRLDILFLLWSIGEIAGSLQLGPGEIRQESAIGNGSEQKLGIARSRRSTAEIAGNAEEAGAKADDEKNGARRGDAGAEDHREDKGASWQVDNLKNQTEARVSSEDVDGETEVKPRSLFLLDSLIRAKAKFLEDIYDSWMPAERLPPPHPAPSPPPPPPPPPAPPPSSSRAPASSAPTPSAPAPSSSSSSASSSSSSPAPSSSAPAPSSSSAPSSPSPPTVELPVPLSSTEASTQKTSPIPARSLKPTVYESNATSTPPVSTTLLGRQSDLQITFRIKKHCTPQCFFRGSKSGTDMGRHIEKLVSNDERDEEQSNTEPTSEVNMEEHIEKLVSQHGHDEEDGKGATSGEVTEESKPEEDGGRVESQSKEEPSDAVIVNQNINIQAIDGSPLSFGSHLRSNERSSGSGTEEPSRESFHPDDAAYDHHSEDHDSLKPDDVELSEDERVEVAKVVAAHVSETSLASGMQTPDPVPIFETVEKMMAQKLTQKTNRSDQQRVPGCSAEQNQDMHETTLESRIPETDDNDNQEDMIYSSNQKLEGKDYQCETNIFVKIKQEDCEYTEPVDESQKLGYVLLDGVGWFKLHNESKDWNGARKQCIEEGGHLAVLESEEEAQWIATKMAHIPENFAYLGIHNHFSKDDWVSVTDKPMEKIGFNKWLPDRPTTETSGQSYRRRITHVKIISFDKGTETCGAISKEEGLLTAQSCTQTYPFICKIPIPGNHRGGSS